MHPNPLVPLPVHIAGLSKKADRDVGHLTINVLAGMPMVRPAGPAGQYELQCHALSLLIMVLILFDNGALPYFYVLNMPLILVIVCALQGIYCVFTEAGGVTLLV